MRRRHLLALLILALVVATVVAVGPVRVWDWMTKKTVEEHDQDGTLRMRYRIWRWSEDKSHAVGVVQAWAPDGALTNNYRLADGKIVNGIVTQEDGQILWEAGQPVEVRTSPRRWCMIRAGPKYGSIQALQPRLEEPSACLL